MIGERRSSPRQIVKSPLYVSLGPSIGGFLRNLSEGGLAIELFGGAVCDQVVRVGFDLPNTGYRIEAIGQISWTNGSARRAGLEFVDIPGGSRRKIRHWISLQNRSKCSRADIATEPEAEETEQFEPSSAKVETENGIFSGYEQPTDLRAALIQAKSVRESRLWKQIIGRLLVLSRPQQIGLGMGILAAVLGSLLIVGTISIQRQSQVSTTPAANKQPARQSDASEASAAVEPAAPKKKLLLNPAFIPRGAILLQVAALTSERDALALAETLQQKKFPAFVLIPSADRYYRVQVGPYRNAASAHLVRHRLEKEGFKAIVKR